MNKPFYSVIIPTYNRQEFLKTAIQSVLNQSFADLELIVVDDGSTDKTKELIKATKDNRLKYIYQEHRGVSSARNKGLEHANALYISFLDSDDRFRPNKLEISYKYLQQYPEVMIFHTEELWYRNNKILNQKKIHRKPDGNVFSNSLRLCCIGISTVVVKKELFNTIGTFDETMPSCEDYDFWLRATTLYPVKLIPEVLTLKEGGHSDQLSKKYPAMDKFRIYAIEKLLKSEILNGQQRQEAIQELKRKCTIYANGAKKRKKLEEAKHYDSLRDKYA